MHSHAATTSSLNRRKSPRHYLDHPMAIEVIYGRHRFAFESGRLSDISHRGLGVRAAHPVRVAPGAPITVAATFDNETIAIHGRVAFAEHGGELGIEVGGNDAQQQLDRIAGALKSVVVAPPTDGLSHIEGKVSMSARLPIQWAIRNGASRLDMTRATEIDSAGLGLLTLMNERHGLCVEHCPAAICRMVKLARLGTVCSPGCPRIPLAIGA
jgi:hypothetical protein